MSKMSYEQGFESGKAGRDPNEPTHTALDRATGIGEEVVERLAADYRAGYEAGTQQRIADQHSDD